MFCIVETVEDGQKMCTAVPKKWVENGNLLWPIKKKNYN
jgi:hypothetical protein